MRCHHRRKSPSSEDTSRALRWRRSTAGTVPRLRSVSTASKRETLKSADATAPEKAVQCKYIYQQTHQPAVRSHGARRVNTARTVRSRAATRFVALNATAWHRCAMPGAAIIAISSLRAPTAAQCVRMRACVTPTVRGLPYPHQSARTARPQLQQPRRLGTHPSTRQPFPPTRPSGTARDLQRGERAQLTRSARSAATNRRPRHLSWRHRRRLPTRRSVPHPARAKYTRGPPPSPAARA